MQIKRFEAKNMTEALRKIKRELGPDAVILSAQDLRRENRLLGISRKIGVEVTAAVDEGYPGMPHSRKPAYRPERIGENRKDAPPMIDQGAPDQTLLHKINDIVRLKGQTHRPDRDQKPVGSRERRTVETNTGSERASIDIHPSPLHRPKDSGHSPIGRYLTKTGLSVGALTLDETTTNIITLVGNAGVGKTTTIAKLAAQFQLIHKKSVGLLSLDRRRIGGMEQLKCYADSMRLPLEMPVNAKDLPQALARLEQCRIVLIDTPAVNPGDPNGLAHIKSHLKAMVGIKTLLVVSAESREEDLQDTARRYTALNPAGAIITKIDLTQSHTDIVNFLCRQTLPVFYFSNGQRVPFDLTEATIERLAARFLQNGMPKTTFNDGVDEIRGGDLAGNGTENQVYLANKNSDIFHRPECKWIRLINQTNIVEFNSFAEALNNRFKPCRYCNPQHLSITRMLSQESAAR
jgi:flagellar biosynthesis protein FlhF